MFLCMCCGCFAEICGDCHFPPAERPKSTVEIRGGDESAQKLRGETSESWLVKFPHRGGTV